MQTILHQSRVSTAQQLQAVLDKQPLVLAVVADAQPVDFSAMAQLQQSCLEEVTMLTSDSLHHLPSCGPGSYDGECFDRGLTLAVVSTDA